ncbi:MAG: fluoride efflux transporter CrcB [SAR324 cluster bacterium]|jgi:CrcB protein|uniref:Fluoride ion transporter CrcB n=1 Tax=marine metagenome TaxID=408172 RepID=A0A381Q5K3_9ZZZZ|nr:fluoride efflux transporter CrcB [Deltaproteobacteria bacterium]MDG1178761.1 fluoride efflux transporter CrcB [SAR324 cluster bacterium]MDG1488099.1 fluoride efflux transporter CrcB [SAR324 cluster bacterium]MDP6211177.1 fluoride efflux transporter CrcB [SAR324 cluster bacterium]MDP6655477.1 fluoride efflux transporter CrcB [SAR324 cluster bacterium]|tara:strand:+ start:129 stop:509 length:381 start_codon:yes stop_codon:yes gene_type:complete
MSEISLLAIALGGACGSVSRFLVAREMGRRLGDFLPYGTLAVNVLGSLALGWLATVFLDRPEINSALRLGIAVGFLGAFTTFSTFSLESVQLLLNGAVWRAMLNIAVNTVVCLGMCYLGMQLARFS